MKRSTLQLSHRRTFAVIIPVIAAIFTLYAVEAILALGNANWIDRLGTTLRKGPSVLSETARQRARGIKAYPFLQPDTFLDSTDKRATIPLSGAANSHVVLCNEMGTAVSYISDSLGFRNPRDTWDRLRPDAALVGDSFAHGFCRNDAETISGQLNRRGQKVINVGLTGAGPLAELGVVREYLPLVRPRNVYWLFYEGNDLIDLTSERTTILARYLDSSFTQKLFERRASVDSVIKAKSESLLGSYHQPGFRDHAVDFFLLRKLRTATGLYRRPPLPDRGDESNELELLHSVLDRASTEVRSWDGQLTLVYLPERRRFNKRTPPVVGENHDPRIVEQKVKDLASQLGIPFIDIAAAFAKEKDPTQLWNSRRYHYNARGYEIVAREIAASLEKR